MTRSPSRGLIAALLACGLFAPSSEALVRDEKSALAEKVVRNPNLHIPIRLQPAVELQGELGARIQQDLAALGIGGDSAFYDARAGRLMSLILSEPLVPGTGVGNTLVGARPLDNDAGREMVWNAVRGFLQERQALIRVDVADLGAPRIAIHEDGNLINVYSQRVLNGIPVRDSGLAAVINHGNLVLLGLDHWSDVKVDTLLALAETQAQNVVAQHTLPYVIEGFAKGQPEYIPMVKGDGYEYRLVWAVRAEVQGDLGSWEGLVDAGSGELIAFEDRNQYASRRVVGGVYPFSNDQRPPDGIEQAGWPMPFANVTIGATTFFTTTGGTLACNQGTGTSTLSGRFIRINDSCGAINETSAGDLDLGSGPNPTDTDCVVPAGHSAGDTKSARTGYYELGRMNEQARAQLPANAWLQAQVTSNMNLPQTCNAFWNGSTVNFFRSAIASGCRNTGEIAGVFDHEWGHGLDDNNTNPSISQPGEAIADIFAHLRLANSCVGRGFYINQVCGGYGDACDGTPATGCTGIRDDDFMAHRCNLPHTITWAISGFPVAQCNPAAPACAIGSGTPCGRETHCEGYVAGETSWDLFARDLQAPPFSFDMSTALELATRLTYLATDNLGAWYTCAAGCPAAGTCGCGATNGYMMYLAADDDNGNINDGTPHLTAIRAAFARHEIHCAATPTPVNSGCATGPTLAPVVVATAAVDGVNLTWNAVPNAPSYNVYRAEGVAACNFGKVKVGNVVGTSFSDTGLLSGRLYSYVVLPVGANTSCFGRASACSSATPTPATCVPTADFTLTCNPSTLTIPPTNSGTSTCTVQSTTGFSAPVNLSCASLPANVTCAYGPATVTPPANGSVNSTLTVTVGPTVPVGTYNFQARGVSGALTHDFAMTLNVSAVSVAPQALAVDAAGNGVFQPSETVVMAPTWRNTGTTAITLTGATSGFTGPAGGTYTNPDSTGAYGTIAPAGQAACTDCYTVNVTTAGRPLTHWDSTIVETVTPAATPKTWTLHIGDSFTDVPDTSGFYRFIETILHKNVTGGCTATTYCPSASTTREQLAVFVLVSKEPPGYLPPACVAPNLFMDVPETSPFCRWIEELANRGVVGGCGPNLYCPASPATREQMAVFVLRTLDPTLNPPACAPPNLFLDVPETSPFCKWIEELARRGVVTGCGGGNYCPTANVTREQMSVFLAVTFGLVLYGL